MVPLPALPNLILFPTLFKCPTCLTLPSISALVKCTHQQDNTLFQPSTILVRFITTAPFLCEACPNPSPDAQYIIALLHSQRISIFLFGFISYTIFFVPLFSIGFMFLMHRNYLIHLFLANI